MRISAKGRYALASVVHMAQQQHSGESITLVSISERLGISKIYLEQVFSLLKRGELVTCGTMEEIRASTGSDDDLEQIFLRLTGDQVARELVEVLDA